MGPERYLVVRVDFAVVEREHDVGAVGQAPVGERREQLAQPRVVVFDDGRRVRAVRCRRRRIGLVESDEVPHEEIRRHRIGLTQVSGRVSQREVKLRLAGRRWSVELVAARDLRRIMKHVGENRHRGRLVDGDGAEGRSQDREMNVVGAHLEGRQLADVGGAPAGGVHRAIDAVAARPQRVPLPERVIADGEPGQAHRRREPTRA